MDELTKVSGGFDSLLKDIGFSGSGGAGRFAAGIGKGAAINIAGTAALSQGMGIQGAKNLEAGSLRDRGKLAKGISQREGIAISDFGAELESDLIAQAAASGGGSADPGVVSLAADIAAEADFRKRTALAEGDITATGLENMARLREFEGEEALRAGKQARKFSKVAAFGSLLGQSENFSFFKKFGEKKQASQSRGGLESFKSKR